MSQPPQPYTISVPDDTLLDLKQRLALARFPSQLESPDQDPWEFGVPAKELQRLANYWIDGFDWRQAESQLNELPQYRTEIEVDGFGVLDIHCKLSPGLWNPLIACIVVHHKSPRSNAIPLLFSHGCTSSRDTSAYGKSHYRRAGIIH